MDDSTQSSPRGALKFLIILRRNCLKILCFLRKKTFQKTKTGQKRDISKKDRNRTEKDISKAEHKQDKKSTFQKRTKRQKQGRGHPDIVLTLQSNLEPPSVNASLNAVRGRSRVKESPMC